MTNAFHTIGLVGKPNHPGANQTLTSLCQWLLGRGHRVLVEEQVAQQLNIGSAEAMELVEMGKQSDLAIVVGGDGNMLGAARVLSRFQVPVIGVNRGNLGFLTDLAPDNFEESLERVLEGEFTIEHRFLLEAEVYRHGDLKSRNSAVNEAVLHPGKIAHMIEFEVYIDNAFVFSQRSDGLIISTPTGSTAYSLSGGGPIISPCLNSICLVPMFPHTLSCRPLVISADSTITLKVSPDNGDPLEVSCDGHVTLAVLPGDEIVIRKSLDLLQLVHPRSYDYYAVLRNKLGWSSKLF